MRADSNMKIKVQKTVEMEPYRLFVSAKVRYWEDGEVNGQNDEEGELIPCRNGDMWEPVIDITTGRIINWEQGKSAKIHYKVCDAGIYTLQDDKDQVISEKDGYVPDCMCPAENGYGDYIIMEIDDKGYIANWSDDFSDFPGIIDED